MKCPRRKNILKGLIQSGEIQSVADLDALVKDLYKEALEGMLEAELDEELGDSRKQRLNNLPQFVWYNRFSHTKILLRNQGFVRGA